MVGMYPDDNDEAEEEVGAASSAADRTLGVGPPNTSIRLAPRTNGDNLLTIVVLDADDDVLHLEEEKKGGFYRRRMWEAPYSLRLN